MLAELWGIEWLFWWQIPLVGVVFPVWLFGGGALLWVGGRFIAQSPKATYFRSVGTNVLAGLASGAALVVAMFLCVAIAGPLGSLLGMLVGGVAGFLFSWLIIKGMFEVRFGKAILAWLPTIPQGLVAVPFVVAALVPTLGRVNELTNRTICMSNLSSIGKAMVLYQGTNDGRMPPNLDALIADGQPAKLFVCPSADPTQRPPGQRFDYFYLPPAAGAGPPPGRILICDFRVNHRGQQRNYLTANFRVHKATEVQFQALLARPVNASFAAALRAIEGP